MSHRPLFKRSAEVGILTNLETGDENSIFKQLLTKIIKTIFRGCCINKIISHTCSGIFGKEYNESKEHKAKHYASILFVNFLPLVSLRETKLMTQLRLSLNKELNHA